MKADVCTHCRYPGGSGDHRCVSGCLSFDFSIKSDSLKTRRREQIGFLKHLRDIATVLLDLVS